MEGKTLGVEIFALAGVAVGRSPEPRGLGRVEVGDVSPLSAPCRGREQSCPHVDLLVDLKAQPDARREPAPSHFPESRERGSVREGGDHIAHGVGSGPVVLHVVDLDEDVPLDLVGALDGLRNPLSPFDSTHSVKRFVDVAVRLSS